MEGDRREPQRAEHEGEALRSGAGGGENDRRLASELVANVSQVAVFVLCRNEEVMLLQVLDGVVPGRRVHRWSVGGNRLGSGQVEKLCGLAHLEDTSTLTGLVSEARWSFLTLEVMVAEKR